MVPSKDSADLQEIRATAFDLFVKLLDDSHYLLFGTAAYLLPKVI